MNLAEAIFITLLTAPMLAAVLWLVDRIQIRNIGRIVLVVVAALATGCGGGEPSSVPQDRVVVVDEVGVPPACPSAEYPAAGALSITDGAVEWLVCSPDEAYRTVIGASDDVVLIHESGSTGLRTIAFDAADGRSDGAVRPQTRPSHRGRSTAKGSSSSPPTTGALSRSSAWTL